MIKKILRDASQIARATAAPDTLLIFGLRDRDRLQIGDMDPTAEELPPAPPLVPADANVDAATGNYQPIPLRRRKDASTLRWIGGIPFQITSEPLRNNGDTPAPLPREIAEAREIYVLYAPTERSENRTNEDFALPLLTLDDGGVAPPADAAPRRLTASGSPELRVASYRLPVNRRIVAIEAGVWRIFAVTVLCSLKK